MLILCLLQQSNVACYCLIFLGFAVKSLLIFLFYVADEPLKREPGKLLLAFRLYDHKLCLICSIISGSMIMFYNNTVFTITEILSIRTYRPEQSMKTQI